MTGNYFAAHESKAWCSLGFRAYEQARKRRACFAAASDASRTAAVGWYGAVGGCPQGWGDPYDGERLESPADRGEVFSSIQREPGVADSRVAGIQQPAAHESCARTRRGGDPALEAGAL